MPDRFRRLKSLMFESEVALRLASERVGDHKSRVAGRILSDSKSYQLWNSRHAGLLRPMAQCSKRCGQIIALRELQVRLLHRCALSRYVREHGDAPDNNRALLTFLFGTRDPQRALCTERREQMLAVSSQICADHLMALMRDPVSVKLVEEYGTIYSTYFELYCLFASCSDEAERGVHLALMLDAREQVRQTIRRIRAVRPNNLLPGFDRLALLEKGNRYEIRNYMVA
jgi:hypothetical protein